jgi:hypothetical protein
MMDIVERAKIKSGKLRMGEPIKFGSDADLIDEMSAEIELLRKDRDWLREALRVIGCGPPNEGERLELLNQLFVDIARAALKEGK